MHLHRIIRIAAVSLGFAAVAAPAAVAQPIDSGPPAAAHQDLSGFYRPMASHSAPAATAPDMALRHAGAGTCGTDYSRNSVDGGYCASSGPSVDLRSPDARDAARGISVRTTAPVPAATPKSNDTDWSKVGIIGGSILGGLALFALGCVLFTRRTPVLTR
jgi:hypothetical protein